MSDLSWKTKRKGYWFFKEGKVKKDMENEKRTYFTIDSDGTAHSVIFDHMKNSYACDCEFFSLKLKDCSHIYAVQLFLKGGENEES
jgi:hypothetical protein